MSNKLQVGIESFANITRILVKVQSERGQKAMIPFLNYLMQIWHDK